MTSGPGGGSVPLEGGEESEEAEYVAGEAQFGGEDFKGGG